MEGEQTNKVGGSSFLGTGLAFKDNEFFLFGGLNGGIGCQEQTDISNL